MKFRRFWIRLGPLSAYLRLSFRLYFQTLFFRLPGGAGAHLGMGHVLASLGDLPGPEAIFCEAARLDLSDYEAHFQFGGFLYKKGPPAGRSEKPMGRKSPNGFSAPYLRLACAI